MKVLFEKLVNLITLGFPKGKALVNAPERLRNLIAETFSQSHIRLALYLYWERVIAIERLFLEIEFCFLQLNILDLLVERENSCVDANNRCRKRNVNGSGGCRGGSEWPPTICCAIAFLAFRSFGSPRAACVVQPQIGGRRCRGGNNSALELISQLRSPLSIILIICIQNMLHYCKRSGTLYGFGSLKLCANIKLLKIEARFNSSCWDPFNNSDIITQILLSHLNFSNSLKIKK